MKYKCKKIKIGQYEYRGVSIKCLGYYPPDKRIVWEGSCDGKSGDYHGYTLKEIKLSIDSDLNN